MLRRAEDPTPAFWVDLCSGDIFVTCAHQEGRFRVL